MLDTKHLIGIYRQGIDALVTDDAFQRILSNSRWLLGANGVKIIISLIQGVLLARVLGVDKYGMLAVITSFSGVMLQVFDSRTWETGIKYVSEFLDTGKEEQAIAVIKLGYLIDIITGVLAFALAWLFAEWGAEHFLGDALYANFIRIYSIVLLLSWQGGTIVMVRVFDHFDLSSKLEVSISLVNLLGVIAVLYLWKGDLIPLLWVYVFTAVFSLMANILLFRHLFNIHFQRSFVHTPLNSLEGYWRNIGHFLFSTNVTGILKIVQSNGAILALGYWSVPAQVGYYKLAQSTIGKLRILYRPLFQTVYPQIAQLWIKKDWAKLYSLLKKLCVLPLILGLPLVIVVWLFGPFLLEAVFGTQFRPAATTLSVLVVVHITIAATNWMGPLLLSAEKAYWQSFSVFVGVMFMSAGLVFLVPRFGSLGAAIAFLLFYGGWITSAGTVILTKLKKNKE